MNHGIFTFANDCKEAYDLMIKYVTKAEKVDKGVLTVKTESRLSLQWHRHRDETWVVARGTAKVILGEEEHTLGRGQSMFVPRNTHHRIENISSVEPLEIIEVQTGDYLGEDDIVRLEDDFGRAD